MNKTKDISLGLTITSLPDDYIIRNATEVYFRIVKDTCMITKSKGVYSFDINLPLSKDENAETSENNRNPIIAYLKIDNKNNRMDKLIEFFEKVSEYSDITFHTLGFLKTDNFIVSSIEIQWASTGLIHSTMEPFQKDLASILKMEVEKNSPKNLATLIRTRQGLTFFYELHKEQYPKELHEWFEYHLSFGKYDKLHRFLNIDWRPPVLNLPSKEEARKILDESISGQERVKKTILAILEVIRRSGRLSKNIMLSGPAGVGKTTIAIALSRLFNLPMSFIPMAGIQDAEAFSGFAGTYNNAQEGLFTTFVLEPKFYGSNGKITSTAHQIASIAFLNELDKVCSEGNNHGSVQSVLLRMLDDNRAFYDVFYEVSYPLENVLIIADVNDKSKLQKPLLDRFMVIEVDGYSTEEKKHIFTEFVFPKALKDACVSPEELSVSQDAVDLICQRSETPGVRELRHVADSIIGDYLVNYSETDTMFEYTADMVRELDDGNHSKGLYFRI